MGFRGSIVIFIAPQDQSHSAFSRGARGKPMPRVGQVFNLFCGSTLVVSSAQLVYKIRWDFVASECVVIRELCKAAPDNIVAYTR